MGDVVCIHCKRGSCDCNERIACPKAGEVGHLACGICPEHNRPRIKCQYTCWFPKREEPTNG